MEMNIKSVKSMLEESRKQNNSSSNKEDKDIAFFMSKGYTKDEAVKQVFVYHKEAEEKAKALRKAKGREVAKKRSEEFTNKVKDLPALKEQTLVFENKNGSVFERVIREVILDGEKTTIVKLPIYEGGYGQGKVVGHRWKDFSKYVKGLAMGGKTLKE